MKRNIWDTIADWYAYKGFYDAANAARTHNSDLRLIGNPTLILRGLEAMR